MDFSVKELLKKIGLSGNGNEQIVGIDIGSSFIKVVQLRKEKERAILETYGQIAVGPYVHLGIGQAAKLSEDTVVNIIKDVLKEANVKAKDAIVSIPLKSSFITVIKLPVTEGQNLSEMIQIEARRYIPVSISEVVLDWWILPDVEGEGEPAGEQRNKMAQILLVATHRDIINNYKSIIAKAGLNAKAYEIESFSMIRSSLGREKSPVLLIDFGALSTKMSVVDYGTIRACHTVSQGSQDLTLALSHSMGVDFGKAEEMKREIGLSDLPEHREMVAVMEPILDFIFSEINIFMKSFQNKNQRPIGRIFMTGGGSLLKGLVDFSIKRFTIEARVANPFEKIEHPAFLSNVLNEVGANFSIAAGLAIREL